MCFQKNIIMSFLCCFVVLACSLSSTFGELAPKEFLEKYGYLGKASGYSNDITAAVSRFQEMANLPVTGQLDSATQYKMKEPRCGVSDIKVRASGYRISKWSRNALTYRFLSYTPDLSQSKTREIIRHAFQVWSAETPLRFTEVNSGRSDFTIGFYSRNHNDGSPFDGKGGVLAHAYFPTDGRAHFDEDERWVDGRTSNGNTNLFYTAAHEIGHAIGLDHVNNNGALMNPYHIDFGRRQGWKLPSVDRYNIQRVYGSNGGGPGPVPTSGTSCRDKSRNCGTHATSYKCSNNPYVKANCQKSCRLCR